MRSSRRLGPLVVVGLMLTVAALFVGATDNIGRSGNSEWQCPAAWPPALHQPEPVNRLSSDEQRICNNVNRNSRVTAEALVALGLVVALAAMGGLIGRRLKARHAPEPVFTGAEGR